MSQRTVLVVGASTGFGAATAKLFVDGGARVIGTSRGAPSSGPVHASGLTMAKLDVCDDASVAALAARLAEAGALPDVIVLNAGYGIAGAAEDTPVEQVQAQFNTNTFGVHRVVRAFLPGMRERRSGRLILIGSVAAQIPIPFQAFYSASKAAAEVYMAALRMEVAAFGIHVSTIEPGDHDTEFGVARAANDSGPDSPYQPQAQRAVAIMEASESSGAPAEDVARLVVRVAGARRPKGVYVQANAMERLALGLKKLLPSRLFERIIMDTYKVPRTGG